MLKSDIVAMETLPCSLAARAMGVSSAGIVRVRRVIFRNEDDAASTAAVMCEPRWPVLPAMAIEGGMLRVMRVKSQRSR